MFAELPDALKLEVVFFIEVNDRIQFAKVNKVIANAIKKDVRRITIWRNTIVHRFFQSLDYRNGILEKIINPYHQLRLLFFSSLPQDLIENSGKNIRPFSLAFLYCTLDELNLFLRMGVIESVKQLAIQSSEIPIELPALNGLQKLELSSCNSFQSFYSPSFDQLRCLKLIDCHDITDVELFRNIYDLHLERCNGIVDISCLFANRNITIIHCNSIEDYSKSFQLSHRITIKIIKEDFIPINPDKLFEVRKLELFEDAARPPLTRSLSLPSSTFLRSLRIYGFDKPFIIPESMFLRDISIQFCENFQSCINLGNIYKVTLGTLPLTSLEGIGAGNRIVEISNCNNITNFNILKGCEKVIIDHCRYFVDASCLNDVKELVISTSNLLPELFGVTHVKFAQKTTMSSVLLLKNMNSVKAVTFESYHLDIMICLKELCSYSHIRRVDIGISSYFDFERAFASDKGFEALMRDNFIFDQPYKIFLRR